MGTRADFYVGRGVTAKWVGSIAMDGYPGGIEPKNEEKAPLWPVGPLYHTQGKWAGGEHLFDSKTEAEFMSRLERFFMYRNDASRPADGWPWPWDNSGTSDYAYAFDKGVVYGNYGHGWFPASNPPQTNEETESYEAQPDTTDWPDMRGQKKVTYGSRSGMIMFTAKG